MPRVNNCRLHGEALEPRLVLDARLVITEMVASNDRGLEDDDGDRPDWLEIYNAGDTAAGLNGWHLTDDARELDKWSFPDLSLAPQQYLVVFASGKDRTDPLRALHTNFKLNASGEYLALVEPDGVTVASAYGDPYPSQRPNVSYGVPQGDAHVIPIGEAASARFLVPSTDNGGAALGTQWIDPAFDDSAWREGSAGIGYDAVGGFRALIATDLEAEMRGIQPTVFLRFPFRLENPTSVFSLTLRMRYDDGYAAFLNGVEVARRNAPDTLGWDSAATATHRNSLALEFEDVDISDFVDLLRSGENVLAVQGLNSSATSNDLLIVPELVATFPAELSAVVPRFFETPTPGGPNGEVSYARLVATTTVSVSRGFLDQPRDVVLTTETAGATIVYTTDGSVPRPGNGIEVAALDPLTFPRAVVHVANTATLRVSAFKEDLLPPPVQTYSYIIASDVVSQDFQAALDAGMPEMWRSTTPDYGMDPDVVGAADLFDGVYAAQVADSLKALPTLSVVMDIEDLFGEQGIYTNPSKEGREWERPASVELIGPDGTIDYQVDAGIRIAGGSARDHANTKKKSFRLVFRSQFGPTKMEFPLFGADAADRFDTIILRNNYNDGWQWEGAGSQAQYLRDEWVRATQVAMGQPGSHGTFVHLFINGMYWGLYNPVERPEAAFSATYVGGNKDEWDALNSGNVVNGSDAAWLELLRLAGDVDTSDQVASNAAFQRLMGKNPDGTRNPDFEVLLDVENMIDYMILNFYAGNTDWPRRNWYVARRRGPESTGFQFYAWDAEWTLNLRSDVNTNRTGVDNSVAQIYGHLRRNEEFRLLFADRVHEHFFNGGAFDVDPEQSDWDPAHPERNVPAARYDRLANMIETPLIAESARWGDQHREPPYTQAEWQTERDALLTNYFPQRSAIVLNQLVAAGLYPRLAAPEFGQHGGAITPGFAVAIDAPGDIFYTLDGSDPRQSPLDQGTIGGGPTEVAMRYTGPITLSGTTVVKARAFADGQWSALNEATFVASDDFGPRPGDANQDGVVDGRDIQSVLDAGKYLTGQPAGFGEGDWNQDGVFDQIDLVMALQDGAWKD